ncbi:MAG TPA: TadE/TadG family type IV pilus assembly protein, partial [Chloroflexota bacterium]|nr:TadE/TadG family type IV pilus assembly protein [Chloroflexota bacterium]
MRRLIRRFRNEDRGSIAVIAILVMVAFMGLVGSAIDLGFMMYEKANLRNAVDAASLAGARQLVSGANPGATAARAAAATYLGYYGYVDGQNGTSVTSTPEQDPLTNLTNRLQVSVTRHQPTYFLQLVGVSTYTVGASATAEASPSMTDIGLSLDLTGSMELSGTNDLQNLQNAVVEFINDVDPNPNAPQGPQIAMARWGGVMCKWNGSYTPGNPNAHPPTQPQYDTLITLSPGPSEYVGPCTDDKSVVTNLTMNKTALLNLATNVTSVPCPNMSCGGALTSWTYAAQDMNGHDGAAQGMQDAGVTYSGLNPTYTGTKEPNAVTVFNDPATGYYAWNTGNCGRNLGQTIPNGCPFAGTAPGNAHKVLVLMTDGNDELWPADGMPAWNDSVGCSIAAAVPVINFSDKTTPWGCWDQQTINRANALKLGPDGVAGTADDVEIYTIGFFCTPYNSSFTAGGHQNWCSSKMAGDTPHECPGAWNQAQASRADLFLYSVSSSTPGTCDHYFPIKKTEQLPNYFGQIAGAIAR